MAGTGSKVKMAFFKGLEAIGKGASNMATNAHQKLSEINLETRRREILSEFPMRAFDLWQKGTELPEPLGDMMAELSDLDNRLSVLRAQRYAKVEQAPKKEPAQREGAEAAGDAEGEAQESVPTLSFDADAAQEATDETECPCEHAGEAANVEQPQDGEQPQEGEQSQDGEQPQYDEYAQQGENNEQESPTFDQPMDEGETGDNA